MVVVGAGLAGLNAAATLRKAGLSPIVLEASDGVGGRVRTDKVDGFLLDRGFQIYLTGTATAVCWWGCVGGQGAMCGSCVLVGCVGATGRREWQLCVGGVGWSTGDICGSAARLLDCLSLPAHRVGSGRGWCSYTDVDPLLLPSVLLPLLLLLQATLRLVQHSTLRPCSCSPFMQEHVCGLMGAGTRYGCAQHTALQRECRAPLLYCMPLTVQCAVLYRLHMHNKQR